MASAADQDLACRFYYLPEILVIDQERMTDDFILVVSKTKASAVMRRATWVLTTSESSEPGAMRGRLHRSQSSQHGGRRLSCHRRMRAQDPVAHPRSVAAGTPRSHATIKLCNQPRLLQNVVHRASTPPPSRGISLQICQASLTHQHPSHASSVPPFGTSQQERILAFDNASFNPHDDDHEHEAPINDSAVHKVLSWVFSRLGLLQLASQLRGKAWNAITIACLMVIALLTAWVGGAQVAQANLCLQISSISTAMIYVLAGIPELIDLCFDLTAGHIDTHVLMTLAVFGTLAIGGALEVSKLTMSVTCVPSL